MKKLVFYTATRAEYGLLLPVMKAIQELGHAPLLAVSGTHLDTKFGKTITEIQENSIPIDCIIPTDLKDNSSVGVCGIMAETITKFSSYLQKCDPDIVVLLGDRFEALAAATAAYTMGLPIVHLHGGELTFGALDDGFRHAITKLSYLHFASTQEYRQRIIQLGESPDRVFHVGSLGVEVALNIPPLKEQDIRAILGLPASTPYLVATYHPVTLANTTTQELLEAFIASLKTIAVPVVFTGANADKDGNYINQRLQAEAQNYPEQFKFFHSLGMKNYHSAVRFSQGVVGNSSSGILEAPSLGVPTLNIGDRQKGRIMAPSIVCCKDTKEAIAQGLWQILSPKQQAIASHKENKYYKANTAFSIATLLINLDIPKHTQKVFYDLKHS